MNPKERAQWVADLMVDEATQGLCEQDQIELETLLSEEPMSESDRFAFLRAATVTEFAFLTLNQEDRSGINKSGKRGQSIDSEFPPQLDLKLKMMVDKLTKEGPGDWAAVRDSALEQPPVSNVITFDQQRKRASKTAWWLAAAASILAAVGWWAKLASPTSAPPQNTQTVSIPDAFPSLEESDYGLVLDLAGTDDVAGVAATGRLLWDPVSQLGVMRIAGLKVNDSSVFQYQLWIFDGKRDERHPIDGGVFDMLPESEGGFLSVPIDARLNVEDPKLFAITIERPGGVVVSERQRIVMVAAVT